MAKTIPYVSMTTEMMTEQTSNALDHYLDKMVSVGIITKEQQSAMSEYKVVYGTQTMWGRLFKKITGKEDSIRMYVIKVL